MADPCIIVLKAAETAARWHADQKSKGTSGAPYINHLLEVASLIAEATGAKDPNLIVAGCSMMRSKIKTSAGDEIAALRQRRSCFVAEVTDDNSLPSKEP